MQQQQTEAAPLLLNAQTTLAQIPVKIRLMVVAFTLYYWNIPLSRIALWMAGLLSSEHVVSDGPAINGRSQSERTLKRPSEYYSGLQPASALRLAIDRQNLTALPVDGGVSQYDFEWGHWSGGGGVSTDSRLDCRPGHSRQSGDG